MQIDKNKEGKEKNVDVKIKDFNRSLPGWQNNIVKVLAIAMSVYHIYALFIGLLIPQIHVAIHLIFALSILYFSKSISETKDTEKIPIYDVIAAVLVVIVFGYVVLNYSEMAARGSRPNITDQYFAILAIILILETTRRSFGNTLPVIAIISLVYAFLGPYLPGILGHRGWDLSMLAFHQFMQYGGIFSVATRTSATIIFMFILFGGFLTKSGGGEKIIQIANSIAGRFIGGPAKVSVIASGLMGSIAGSAVANTVTTGQFTIPLMKHTGYKPHFAGGVEAAASTGGLIMPPIMGAGAFVMAEMLGLPYVTIITAAIIPALLYYVCVFMVVHCEARKLNLAGIPISELPILKNVLRESVHVVIPILGLIYFLVTYVPVIRAALYSVGLIVVFSFLSKKDMMTPGKIIGALEEGAKNAVGVASACATAGIVIGVINGTGLGMKLSGAITGLAQEFLLPSLFFAMIVLVFLGMGLPAVAAYLIGATVAAPGLVRLGIEPLVAHMFVFFFANVAHITPPIALAAYAGASIAKADVMQTVKTAFLTGISVFLIPYMFLYDNALLMMGDVQRILPSFVIAVIGICFLAMGINGFLNKKITILERFLLIIFAVMMVQPFFIIKVISVLFGILWLLLHYDVIKIKRKSEPS